VLFWEIWMDGLASGVWWDWGLDPMRVLEILGMVEMWGRVKLLGRLVLALGGRETFLIQLLRIENGVEGGVREPVS